MRNAPWQGAFKQGDNAARSSRPSGQKKNEPQISQIAQIKRKSAQSVKSVDYLTSLRRNLSADSFHIAAGQVEIVADG